MIIIHFMNKLIGYEIHLCTYVGGGSHIFSKNKYKDNKDILC